MPAEVSQQTLRDQEVSVRAPFYDLETLWFQLTGFLCNLECTHCFISCGPNNRSLELMSRGQVLRYLKEAEALGVREVYFTGGEPFIHGEILEILADALAVVPTTVLTNGVLITEKVADRLAELSETARYSLEIRISLDDVDEARNDAVRGKGCHRKVVRALRLLDDRGLLPIVTATEYLLPDEEGTMYERFRSFLLGLGIEKPRVKIIPVFTLGRLADEDRGPRITPEMVEDFDFRTLQCTSTRLVSARGIHVCPILVGEPEGLMETQTLAEAARPIPLGHSACHTCYVTGMTCSNF